MLYKVSSSLNRQGAKLKVLNDLGQDLNPNSVKYTVYDAYNNQVSGKSLSALRVGPTEYLAQWRTDLKSGAYHITWELVIDDLLYEEISQMYLIQESAFAVKADLENKVFPVGNYLIRGDLPIFFRDEGGTGFDPFYIVYYFATPDGCLLSQRSSPSRYSSGEYFIPGSINFLPGNYLACWEYKEYSNSPLTRKTMEFGVINESLMGGGV